MHVYITMYTTWITVLGVRNVCSVVDKKCVLFGD